MCQTDTANIGKNSQHLMHSMQPNNINKITVSLQLSADSYYTLSPTVITIPFAMKLSSRAILQMSFHFHVSSAVSEQTNNAKHMTTKIKCHSNILLLARYFIMGLT